MFTARPAKKQSQIPKILSRPPKTMTRFSFAATWSAAKHFYARAPCSTMSQTRKTVLSETKPNNPPKTMLGNIIFPKTASPKNTAGSRTRTLAT